jgi:hypothetical protein
LSSLLPATWAAETRNREAEKAPAILAHFGCNVEENTCMLSTSFLSPSLKNLEYEIEEISVHET